MEQIEVIVKIEHEGVEYQASSNVTENTLIGWSTLPEKMQKEVDDCVAHAAQAALAKVGKQIVCRSIKSDAIPGNREERE